MCILAGLPAFNIAAQPFLKFQSLDSSLYAFGGNKVDPSKTLSPVVEAWGDYSIGDMYVYGIWQRSLLGDYVGSTSTYYYKAVPRLSLSRNINKDISYGVFKDASAALWISRSKGEGFSYYPGLALDWQIPGFSWLRTIYYYEHNYHKGWDDRRLHIDYGYPFHTTMGDFRIVGTFDMTSGQGNNPVMIDFKPELHYDLGQALGYPSGHLWLGAVIEPIKNKYKIEDSSYYHSNQFSYGIMVRYSFSFFPD
ncbi:hypothetical protein EHW66_15100 [Erwinia psidii]|uniref:hypothetical protein n=1 Tax=Erwinia psidii TaxID=69224 RepID=UPI00226B3EFE|nr:hypothetical protein [Erwinia psidii]MCX8966265.1 hypothetical protein [Erwinia psidii]